MKARERHLTHPEVTEVIGPVLCGAKRRNAWGSGLLKQTKDRAQVTCRRCLWKLTKSVWYRKENA